MTRLTGWDTDDETSVRLGHVRHADTAAELTLRSILYAIGLHYRVRNRDLPGTPDMANRRHRWAVFVHGCFWHAHTGCPRATIPTRNRALWLAKFGRNKARDARAVKALRKTGFRVVVIWECELTSRDLVQRRLVPLVDLPSVPDLRLRRGSAAADRRVPADVRIRPSASRS